MPHRRRRKPSTEPVTARLAARMTADCIWGTATCTVGLVVQFASQQTLKAVRSKDFHAIEAAFTARANEANATPICCWKLDSKLTACDWLVEAEPDLYYTRLGVFGRKYS